MATAILTSIVDIFFGDGLTEYQSDSHCIWKRIYI